MVERILILALFNSSLLMCFQKWDWLNTYDAIRPTWMPEGGCFLCLGFWLTVITALPIYWLFALHVQWILYPFCATPIICYLTSPRI